MTRYSMFLSHVRSSILRTLSSNSSILLIPKILFLVEQIRPRTTQVDNLRTTVSIFLQSRALEAIECVTDTLSTTDDTLVLVIAERALIAYSYESRRSHI